MLKLIIQISTFKHEVEKQWSNLGVKQDDKENAKNKSPLNTRIKSLLSLSWSDYHARILPNGKRDNDDTKRINREWRRWRLADKDGDNRLTKQEFKVLKHQNYNYRNIIFKCVMAQKS